MKTNNFNTKTFRQLLHESFKSEDTEEWLDIYFTRPIGLFFARIWYRLGVTPNNKNNLDLVQWAIAAEAAGWGYVWGTFGQVLTRDALAAKVAQYPDNVGIYEEYIRNQINNWRLIRSFNGRLPRHRFQGDMFL